ncbi:DUF6238 family protein [Streptomyces sp. NPDC001633]|uniref:DUF6238 family protein n=1 Tax=Streptomyces sp. NPDC001633 TaxID=3364595 RepID=UPI003693F5C2
MTPPTDPTPNEPLAYLRAATAGLRHHTRTTVPEASPTVVPDPASRAQIDALHIHLTTLHALLDQLAVTTRRSQPGEGGHLAAARTRVWQATEHLHDAFHTAPSAIGTAPGFERCRPEKVLESGPPFLTICQRHLVTTVQVRRQTTPTELHSPLHGHATHRAA